MLLILLGLFFHFQGHISNLEDEDGIDKITNVIEIQGNLGPINFQDSNEWSPRLEEFTRNVVSERAG